MGFWDAYSQAYSTTKQSIDAARASQASAQISGALAKGDYAGAAQAAFAGGNGALGASLLSSSQSMAKLQRQTRFGGRFGTSGALNSVSPAPTAQGALSGALNPPQPITPPATTVGALTSSVAPAVPTAPPAAGVTEVSPITVTAPRPTNLPGLDDALTPPAAAAPVIDRSHAEDALRQAYADADPEEIKMAQTALDGIKDHEVDAFSQRGAYIANALAGAKSYDIDPKAPDQGITSRRAFLHGQAKAAGINPAAVDALPDDALTDEGLNGYIGRIYAQQGYKGVTGFGDLLSGEAKAAAQAAKDARDAKHQTFMEGISAGTLGVARGGLAVRQAAHQARLKGIGGYGTPGASQPPSGPSTDEAPPEH